MGGEGGGWGVEGGNMTHFSGKNIILSTFAN